MDSAIFEQRREVNQLALQAQKAERLSLEHLQQYNIRTRVLCLYMYLNIVSNLVSLVSMIMYFLYLEPVLLYLVTSLVSLKLLLNLILTLTRSELHCMHYANYFHLDIISRAMRNAKTETDAYCQIIYAVSLEKGVQFPVLDQKYLQLSRKQTSAFLKTEQILSFPQAERGKMRVNPLKYENLSFFPEDQ